MRVRSHVELLSQQRVSLKQFFISGTILLHSFKTVSNISLLGSLSCLYNIHILLYTICVDISIRAVNSGLTTLMSHYFASKDHVVSLIAVPHRTTTFVCSLNPIRQTSIPRPYNVISLLSFHHCSSQQSQYLSVSSRAYTHLLNESIEKQRLPPDKRRNQSKTCLPSPWLMRI